MNRVECIINPLRSCILWEGVPVRPVVVVHVHEDGHWLAKDKAAPHNDVPQLTLEEWHCRQYAQWQLEREREGEVDI